MSVKALTGKVFLLITGASRGIGRQIAITFGSLLEEGSHVLLLATNLNGLKETATKLPSKISVDPVSIDLSKATKNELHDVIVQSLKNTPPKSFDRVVVIHNVGSVGDVTKRTTDMTDLNNWHNYYNLNVFIPAILNGVVMNIFEDTTQTEKAVINITSLYGITPGKSMGYYCSGKAAREMFFKVFALENPEIDVLNYSPGPVDTEMFNTVCDTIGDEKTKKGFNEVRTNKTVLTAQQTTERLLGIVRDHKYNSGDHVDYYDKNL